MAMYKNSTIWYIEYAGNRGCVEYESMLWSGGRSGSKSFQDVALYKSVLGLDSQNMH